MKKNMRNVLWSKKVKKGVTMVAALALAISTLTACGSNNDQDKPSAAGSATESADKNTSSNFDTSKEITVVSREDGSGTRGAFIELFGIEEKGADGTKVDHTTDEASVTNNTATMMTTVANSEYSIGYISLGSLNDTIKAVKIDGTEATQENVKNGSYKVVRPFNIVTKESISDAAKDFINFILSTEGQKVVSDNHYIALDGMKAFTSNNASGKVVIAGSSSVSPLMEKLKEAYVAVNSNVSIEVQTNDSSTGVSSAIEGTCDIGMASRELKDSENDKGVGSTVIAQDGIAVIVNNDSTLTDLTSDQVKSIFTGEVTEWNEIIK